MLTILVATFLYACGATAEEYDFYQNLRYSAKLVPGVRRNKVEQEGGPDATGYRRRTVKWWPRKGQDVIDVPKGVPLRTWTRNKGRQDKEALAGLCRNWTESDPETFKAHLVGFRGFAVPTPNPTFSDDVLIPAAVLRLENGEQRAVVHHTPFSLMLSPEDHDFILKKWQEEWPKLLAPLSKEQYVTNPRDIKTFPPNHPGYLVLESDHWRFQAGSTTWVDDFYLLCPEEPEKQARYRKGTLEFAEGLWACVEAAGARMPFWREFGPKYKFAVTTGPSIKNGWERLDPGNGGGYGCCTVYWCGGGPRNVKLSHEFGHSGYHGENGCNAMIHTLIPGELQMFSHNFCYPWRNVMFADYQAGLWMIALGDNPNWGYGIVPVLGSLRSVAEPTLYHAVARLGQKKGLWINGIKGLGDFFGEYAARTVTIDLVEQPVLRCKYGMPEVSCVYPVYGRDNTYRVPNSEAPRVYGFNIIRLKPEDGAEEVTVGFHGFYESENHSDWRACIVAVDGNGRARYSPLWNKGKMVLPLRPTDKHLWLTVAATPSALPVREDAGWHGGMNYHFKGNHAPRFPWEVALTGCRPGTPHRRQGDVVNLEELYTINNTNFFVDHAVKHEVPIPCWEADAKLARKKLAAMLPRIKAASDAVQARLEAGNGHDEYWLKDWHEFRKLERLEDLRRRVKFLRRNTKGHRHDNGGGFVAEGARVAPTAYVGPNAMVLDGARVEGDACIKEYAVVIGPRAVVSGNAKIGGKAWVFGDVKIDGNARILESVVLATSGRFRGGYHLHSRYTEGEAHITGNAVIKGEHIMRLCHATDQVLTGGLVVDYTPKIANRRSGVFRCGRFCHDGPYNWAYTPVASIGRCLHNGLDAGALYANWQFDQPKSYLLEDSYVNNNGILYGEPEFSCDEGHRCAVFNGTDQYAEAPPSVADFGELTIDVRINRSGGKDQRLFDFGTGDDECFYLALSGKSGKPALVAVHEGKNCWLTSSEAVPADKWAGVRVEMNGSEASIYVDGKRVATGAFHFRPREVFIGDRAEGNFIGCDRNKAHFFKGRIDHFRIYRKVHDDFDALGEVPPALTQVLSKEACEKAARFAIRLASSPRAAQWRRRRAAKDKELAAQSASGNLGEEAAELDRRKSQLLGESEKLDELSEKRRAASEKKGMLDRKVLDKFNALAEARKANREIGELREKIDRIMREIRQTSEYTDATRAIHAAEERLREFDKEVREGAAVKAIEEKARAADAEKGKIEETIRQLPELKKAMDLYLQEKDRQRKDELRRKYESLLSAKRSSDSRYQEVEARRRELWDLHNKTLRRALDHHAGRTKTNGELNVLRERLRDLEDKLKAERPNLAETKAFFEKKQQSLERRKREFLSKAPKVGELKDEYQEVLAEIEALDRAIGEEKKRLKTENLQELAKIGKRLNEIHQQRKSWRLDRQGLALQEAGLLRSPFGLSVDEGVLTFQQGLEYRSTADWDYRTRQEINDEVPPTMKEWLERVRGY